MMQRWFIYLAISTGITYFFYSVYRAVSHDDLESDNVGLQLVADGLDPAVDIVAIHGLDGHWNKTWTASNNAFWLRDFLPAKIRRARVFSYGYDSKTHGARQLSQLSLHELGRELITELAAMRHESRTEPRRPIIFITHSLGGLILKSGLSYAHTCGEKNLNDHKEIKLSTYGIVFIGCPHQGGNGARIATTFARIISLVYNTNWNVLQHLQENSEWVREHEDYFAGISREFELSFFYEEYAMRIPFPGLFGLHVVPQYSAVIPGKTDAKKIALPGDHRGMVKFRSPEAIGFKRIVRELNFLLEKVDEWKTSKVLELETKCRQSTFVQKDFEIPFSLYQKNWKFSGRVPELQRMREILKTAEHEKTLSSGLVTKHRSERRVVALCGAGGMGKSQLALMHAHEHVTRAYSSVIWINAHSRAILDASIAKIAKEIADHYGKETPATYQRFARVLGFPEDPRMLLQSFQESDIAWKLGILPKWLALPENHHWLVVIDNNDRVQGNTTDRDSILPEREFLPSTGGSVIVTTRLTGRAGLYEKLKIKEMDPKSSLELLLKSAGMERETLEPHVIAEAEKLVEDLGGLPIALDQAGAYIQQRDVDFTEYRDRLQRYFKEVAQASSDGASERLYDQPAFYWTWDISYRDLKEQHPNAAELLVLCAFLHNVEIHEELLRRGKIFDEMILNEAVDTLASYSLITRSMGTTGQPGSRMKSFSMHALAHKWARIQLSPEDQKQYTKKAMGIISSATSLHEKKRNDSDWFFGQMIEPHIHACRGYLESYLKDDILDIDSALAAHNIGIAFDDLSLFQLAELPYRKALQGLENADRQEKNLTAVRHSFGKNLSYQSRYAEAHEYLKPVIEYHELHGEKTSIGYLDALHSIGAVYRYQGKLEDALQNYKAAHDGFLQHHPENQGLLLAKLEIGYVHQLMHNPEASLKWLQPALVGFERDFGPLHPWTLNTVHFIANVYRRQKKYDDALAWYHRALAGKEEKLGKDHLSTLGTVAAIAETDIVMGRCEEGLAGYRRALEGRKKATGENSMWTLSAVHGVGFALQGMGDYTGALEYYRRALDGRRKVMGDDHQQTLESVHSLVEVYQLLGQEHEAERLCGEYKIGYKKGV